MQPVFQEILNHEEIVDADYCTPSVPERKLLLYV